MKILTTEARRHRENEEKQRSQNCSDRLSLGVSVAKQFL